MDNQNDSLWSALKGPPLHIEAVVETREEKKDSTFYEKE